MLIPILLVGSIVIVSAYGCAHIIAHSYGIHLPLPAPWLYQAIWAAGPPISVIACLFAWSHARSWRRMAEFRTHQLMHGMTAMGRGQHRLDHRTSGPSLLERLLILSIFISLASIPYWYATAQAEVWVIGGIVSWWVIGKLLRMA